MCFAGPWVLEKLPAAWIQLKTGTMLHGAASHHSPIEQIGNAAVKKYAECMLSGSECLKVTPPEAL